jgi:hypothetical protein
LLLVAGVQAALFVWHLRLIRAGLSNAKEAADTARDTAQATTEAITLARETAERQLRAYVFVHASSREGAHSLTPEFHIEFKNFGQTPARGGTYWVHCKIDDYWSESGFERPSNVGVGRFELAPSGVGTITGINAEPNKVSVDGDKLAPFTERKTAFFVFGQIDYVDAFSQKRTTKFRLRYDADGVRYGRLAACKEGNEAA